MRRITGVLAGLVLVGCSDSTPAGPDPFVSLASFLGPLSNHGDLAPPAIFNTRMRDDLEVPACVSASKGHAHVAVHGDGSIESNVALNNQGAETIRFGHIHVLNPGQQTGPIVWWVSPMGQNLQSTARTLRFHQLGQFNAGNGIYATHAEALAAFLANPGAFYVNFHSNSCPGGFARGFLD